MQVITKSGIVWTDGLLTLSNSKGDLIQIKEMAMADFERFYRLWHSALAITLKPDNHMSFVQAWSKDSRFRSLVTEALVLAGVEQPGLLKPRQLEELLLSAVTDENEVDTLSTAMLFRLHYQAPGKVEPVEEAESEPKKQPKRNSINSLWQGIRLRVSSMILALPVSGL